VLWGYCFNQDTNIRHLLLGAKYFLKYLFDMRDLIKKILNEFVDNQSVKFLVIGEFVGNLNEQIDKKKKGEAWFKLKNYASSVSPFIGRYFDKRLNKEKEISFSLVIKDHFVERSFRLDDPSYQINGKNYNPEIVNPGLFEGINLILKNSDELAKSIGSGYIKDNDMVEMSTIDGSRYHMVVKFDELYRFPLHYELILLTQIKGTSFFGKKYQKRLKIK
jgi:hypothetical protein